jgi:hypothetical protein
VAPVPRSLAPSVEPRIDSDLGKQAWYPIFRRHASPNRLLLVERGERSFIIIFRKTPRP